MMTENLAAFFDVSEFGTTATIGGASVLGILGREYVEVQTRGGAIAGYKPVFDCAAADVSTVEVGDAVTVEGESYTVAAPKQPDGTGMARLILKESTPT